MERRLLDALASGATVVAANKRLARQLHLQFGRSRIAVGETAWKTPDITPWQSWLRRLWQASVFKAGRAGRRDLLSEQQERFLWSRLIAESGDHEALSDLDALAEAARDAWRLQHDWELDPGAMASAALTLDQRAFGSWARRYRAECEASGWSDLPAVLDPLARDLRDGAVTVDADIFFVGFDVWAPARERLRAALGGRGIRVDASVRDVETGAAYRTACADPEHEAALAARWARRRFESDPDADIAVVVPDLSQRAAQIKRLFMEIFAPDWRAGGVSLQAPVNLSFGRPLADYGLIDIALLLLRLPKRSIDYRDLGRLLRCPYLPGGSTEADRRALLDLAIRERGEADVDIASITTLVETHAPGFARILAHAAPAGVPPKPTPPSAWCNWFSASLEAIGWPGDRALDSVDFQAANAWNDLLKSFGACDRIVGAMSHDQACTALARMARRRIFQPEGAQPAVQVMGMLEASGQRFDYLWVCGMAGEDWPPRPKANPMIPLSIQRDAEMPDSSPQTIHEFASGITSRLRSSAAQLVMSWPVQRGDEMLTASSLIGDLSEVPVDQLDVWAEVDYNRRILAAGHTELLESDPAPPVPADSEVRGGAGILARQSVCPARAFVEYRLGAHEIAIPGLGIDGRARGQVVHRALERVFERCTTRVALVELGHAGRAELLTQAIAAALMNSFGPRRGLMAVLIRLERERLQALLLDYLEMEMQRGDFEVEARELEQFVRLGGIDIRLRLDRIDRLADGALLVLDYKTGEASGNGWAPARPTDPQLPVYATVSGADGIALAQLRVGKLRYIGVGQPGIGVDGISTPDKARNIDADSWPELVERWRASLDEIAGEFRRGDYRLDRNNLDLARGQYSILTRVHDLAGHDG